MSVDIGNPTEQILADATRDLEKALPTEADKIAAADKFQTTLNNEPEVKKSAYEDVKQLAESIRALRQGFLDVSHSLVAFDAMEFKDRNGNVAKLGPKWQPYIIAFDDTLLHTLQQATTAVTTMKSINMVLGDVTHGDAMDLKNELTNFMRQLDTKMHDVRAKDKFQQLSDNVAVFRAEIEGLFKDSAEDAKAILARLRHELTSLYQNLQDVNQKIRALGTATLSSVTVGAGAAAAAILTLSPIAIATSLDSFISGLRTGIALAQAMDERSGLIYAMHGKAREIAAAAARDEQIQRHKAPLDKVHEVSSRITDVTAQLAAIGNIWQTIYLDIRAISDGLGEHVGPDTIMSKFFLKKLQVTKDLYRHLIFLVETFVEQAQAANLHR